MSKTLLYLFVSFFVVFMVGCGATEYTQQIRKGLIEPRYINDSSGEYFQFFYKCLGWRDCENPKIVKCTISQTNQVTCKIVAEIALFDPTKQKKKKKRY